MYAKLERKDWSCDIKQEKYATDSNGWSCIGNKSNQLILFRALRKRTKIRIVYRFRSTRLFFYFQHLIYYAQILMNASKSEWMEIGLYECVWGRSMAFSLNWQSSSIFSDVRWREKYVQRNAYIYHPILSSM